MSALNYVGDGSWLPGVPARNLSAAEVEEHGGVEVLLRSGLYALVTGQPAIPEPPYPPPAEPVNPELLPQVEEPPAPVIPEVLVVPFAEAPEPEMQNEDKPRGRGRRRLPIAEAEVPGTIEEV